MSKTKLNIQPLADRVLIQPAPAETVTKGGIIIPDTLKEKPQRGEVLAVGDGKYAELTGTLIPMKVKVGDVVLYGKYSGTEVSLEEGDFLIMRESEIFLIL